ncbi:addiction module antitoxin [Dickeya chrysanthemi]|uniref:type II toxin-antitoxin system antitoxin DhiA n=1 Tax=Dickeya TaxID=204037 RepID=UPI0003A4D090|nr:MULTISPECIES: addiction module antitoxin [Dickeya]TYL42203.1 addiction module antitoxin [Dickeya sp. ws52]WJM86142.1 addiction module antitoxin [Dickeya chrysanthemi]
MHKIVEVDVIGDFSLRLTYDDGLVCDINLYQYAPSPVFSNASLFIKFGLLPDGSLEWLPDIKISASELRKKGEYVSHTLAVREQNFADIISRAFYDAVIENRPEILQAALKTAVDKHGNSTVAKEAGAKSRTSLYKSLNKNTHVSLATVVSLAHTVLQLEEK